jgi:hypothetical protein
LKYRITPTGIPSKKKYDTWFFIAELENAEAKFNIDNFGESEDIGWFNPNLALDKFSLGDLPLAPPTFYILNQLKAIGKMEDLRRVLKTQNQVFTIHPQISLKPAFVSWILLD